MSPAVVTMERLDLGAGVAAPTVVLLRCEDAASLRARARALCAQETCSSRSYSPPYGLVATWQASVGVDIEAADATLGEDFAHTVCTPRERSALGSIDLASLWSGKEALAKALGDAVQYDPRRLEAPLGWRDGRSGPWRAARLELLPTGFTGWVCWRGE